MDDPFGPERTYRPLFPSVNDATRNAILRDLRLKLEDAEMSGAAVTIPPAALGVVLDLLPSPRDEGVPR